MDAQYLEELKREMLAKKQMAKLQSEGEERRKAKVQQDAPVLFQQVCQRLQQAADTLNSGDDPLVAVSTQAGELGLIFIATDKRVSFKLDRSIPAAYIVTPTTSKEVEFLALKDLSYTSFRLDGALVDADFLSRLILNTLVS